jgi:hypothetical protein
MTFLTNTRGFKETLNETLNCRLIWHYRVWERISKRILTFCILPSGKVMFKNKNTLILRKNHLVTNNVLTRLRVYRMESRSRQHL